MQPGSLRRSRPMIFIAQSILCPSSIALCMEIAEIASINPQQEVYYTPFSAVSYRV
jgi:hypothetical protein